MNAAAIARSLPCGRRSGSSWLACCPAHADRNPSLSLRDAPGGMVLVHCHAGCSQSDVVASLKEKGLWPESRSCQQRLIVAEYSYTDESGQLLYQVVRTEPKGFFQRYPDGAGGWINRKHPRQVLYRLPEVNRASIVFVVEGEKDADRLCDFGFRATTNAGGAHAPWTDEYTIALSGKDIILIPDRDVPGRSRVVRIARALLGSAARVRILELNDSKDIAEWFERGHSEVELINLIERNSET